MSVGKITLDEKNRFVKINEEMYLLIIKVLFGLRREFVRKGESGFVRI